MSLNSDKNIIYYEKLTKIVHHYQTKIILQVNYAGENEEMPNPTELSKEKIKDIIVNFGNTAVRAQKAGFDGVQIHAAHGFFLSKFLSMNENKRNDEYGGSLENNLKIIIEIIKEIRNKKGNSFHIFVKIDCIDSINSKSTFDIFVYTSQQLSKLGISGIEITGNVFNKLPNEVSKYKESIFRDYASFIAQEIKTPIILVGFNRSPEVMEEILNKTKISYFPISRPLIHEPNLINIWQKNPNYRPKCISCNKCFRSDGNRCIFTS